jgi:hypothetical protein
MKWKGMPIYLGPPLRSQPVGLRQIDEAERGSSGQSSLGHLKENVMKTNKKSIVSLTQCERRQGGQSQGRGEGGGRTYSCGERTAARQPDRAAQASRQDHAAARGAH